MVISEVSLGTMGIDILRNENLGLMIESNVNASNESGVTQDYAHGNVHFNKVISNKT